jgi:hypothetical protein
MAFSTGVWPPSVAGGEEKNEPTHGVSFLKTLSAAETLVFSTEAG